MLRELWFGFCAVVIVAINSVLYIPIWIKRQQLTFTDQEETDLQFFYYTVRSIGAAPLDNEALREKLFQADVVWPDGNHAFSKLPGVENAYKLTMDGHEWFKKRYQHRKLDRLVK